MDPAIEDEIAAALAGPLAAIRRVDPAKMNRDTLGDYISAMTPVLFLIVAEQRRQHFEDMIKQTNEPKTETDTDA